MNNINIEPANKGAMEEARARQDSRVKVPKSLGRLEDISIKIAGITGKAFDNDVSNQAIVLMCADNGIVDEGVASAPQTVTLMQTINFTKKITGVGSQAKYFGIDLLPVDVGVKLPIPEEYLTDSMFSTDEATKGNKVADVGQIIDENNIVLATKVVNRRIADGTRDFLKEPAMTKDEAIRAIKIGVEAADACKAAGKNLIGVGEMGIGNTTTASAIIMAFALAKGTDISSRDKETNSLLNKIVGRGGGLNDEGLNRKKAVIKDGLLKYKDKIFIGNNVNVDSFDSGSKGQPGAMDIDVIELLSTVGGFDIAGMAGVYLGAAANRIPVVVDGVISIAAALIAAEINPLVKDYMFTSHRSEEGAYSVAAELLGIEPMYDLGMKLGEGSGCPIAFKIIEAACAVMNNMWSLDEASVDSGYLEELKRQGQFQ